MNDEIEKQRAKRFVMDMAKRAFENNISSDFLWGCLKDYIQALESSKDLQDAYYKYSALK